MNRAEHELINARRAYWHMVTIQNGCAMCKHEPPPEWAKRTRAADLAKLEGHHIIGRQDLKREGRGGWRITWDLRNGLGLCAFHHQRHTNHVQRVPREILPDEILEFVDELQLDWLLDRDYP